MGNLLDLTGKTFGRLTVIGKALQGSSSNLRLKWDCVCSCGNHVSVRTDSLTSGHTKSCGCYSVDQSKIRHTKNLSGFVVGRLTVLSKDELASKPGSVYWLCKCSCGNTKSILSSSLVKKKTQSCGCLSKEVSRNLTVIRNYIYRLKHELILPSESIRLRRKHKNWRNRILVRDNHTCVLCNSSNRLVVHHIVPLCCNPIDSEDNLVTLCHHCHVNKAHYKHMAEINPVIQKKLQLYIKSL